MSCFNYAWYSTRLPSNDFRRASHAYHKLVRPQTIYIKLPKGSISTTPSQPGRSAIENRQKGNHCTVFSAQRWPPMPLSNPLNCSTVTPGHFYCLGYPTSQRHSTTRKSRVEYCIPSAPSRLDGSTSPAPGLPLPPSLTELDFRIIDSASSVHTIDDSFSLS
jgi:hypothetical protein